jgi:molybdopterin synthase catalytic subunit
MQPRILVTPETLEPAAVDQLVSASGIGGRVLFCGAVREENRGRRVWGMRYEAYVPMAEKVLATICEEAAERFAISAAAVHHRVGELAVGEVAVVVAVGAAHREAAFDACRYIIDELKLRAPIWKREHYADGDA